VVFIDANKSMTLFFQSNIFMENCVLSLGSRHSVGSQKLNTQTQQKVCVWCVFESHTHSVSEQKLVIDIVLKSGARGRI
jgi:hypothetical protein